MFKIIIRLAIICIIHIVLFASYPETGKNGNLFLGISLFCWTALLFMLSVALRSLPIIGKLISAVVMLVFYVAAAGFTAYLMPQTDKVTVYEKILKGKYPEWSTFKRGLGRFGIDADDIVNKSENAIELKKNEIEQKAIQTLKETQEDSSKTEENSEKKTE